jgi:hypothetical protein
MSQFDEGPSDGDAQLESQLRDALRAVAPSEAFTEALLARLASERSRELGREPSSEPASGRIGAPNDAHAARVAGRTGRYSGWWLPASLAAAVLVAVGAVQHLKAEHEREMGLEARREVIEALRVTNQKLDLAYQAVRTQSTAVSEGDPGA